MYRSLAAVEQEACDTAVTADDLKRCRLCGTCYVVHYWQCDWDDNSSRSRLHHSQLRRSAHTVARTDGTLLIPYYSHAHIVGQRD